MRYVFVVSCQQFYRCILYTALHGENLLFLGPQWDFVLQFWKWLLKKTKQKHIAEWLSGSAVSISLNASYGWRVENIPW